MKIVLAALVSLGGGGAIVLGLSNWLGKLWAEKMMAAERHKQEQALETLKAELRRTNDAALAQMQQELQIHKEKHLRGHSDKLHTYRLVVDIISEFLADLDLAQMGTVPKDGVNRLDRFNRQRLKAYGYLGMLAPGSVMDAYDRLGEYLLDSLESKEAYEWVKVRALAIDLLNEIRKDIQIDASPITYKGHR